MGAAPPSQDHAAAVWRQLDAVEPWDKNPRTNDHAVPDVAASISSTAWGAPLVAQRSSGRVIAGHTRLKAARYLTEHVWQPGDDELAGHWRERTEDDGPWQLDGAPAAGMIPVRYVDVDDETADRMAIADNRTGELSGWEEGGLAEIMGGFRDSGDPDWLFGLGFQPDEAAAVLGEWVDPFADVGGGAGGDDGEIADDGRATITVSVPITAGGDVAKRIADMLTEAGIEHTIKVK